MDLIFLGTGACCGVPAFYCRCRACMEALADSKYNRTRCAVAIHGNETILIDTPPELAGQLSREGIKDVDFLVLTHGHYDHIGGLGDLEYYIRLHRLKPMPAIMTKETWQQLQISFDSVAGLLDVSLVEPGDVIEAGAIRLTALDTVHESGTLGFLIEHDKKYTAYIPDTGQPPADTMERLFGIECLIIDATLWGNNRYPEQHLSLSEAIALGQSLEVKKLYLTHLSMHYDTPVTSLELERTIESCGEQVHLAYDGLRLPLDSG